MATSAFRSTTKRTTPMGKSSTGCDDYESSSSNQMSSHRRHRSLSRFSHRMRNLEDEVTPIRRGKFVNTVRGSGFPEISLDDLAIEFFDSFSAGSAVGGGVRGRSGSRKSVGGGEAEFTVSQRRGRSVSRAGLGSNGGLRRLDANTESSCRRRSVSRLPSRGSGGNNVGTGKLHSGNTNSRRRRSVSVARCRISDSESQSDIDHFQSSSNRGNLKSSISGNSQFSGSRNLAASDHRPGLRRSFSQNEIKYLDGYSSHSSAITDDEVKNTNSGGHGMERKTLAVHSQNKGEHPMGDELSGGLYEAMRKELTNAVKEIKTEATMKTKKSFGERDYGSRPKSSDDPHAISTISKGYTTKFQQHGRELSKVVKELLTENSSEVSEKPAWAGKRSKVRNRMSKCLSDEAEKYIEEFISNIEDTDISSMDDERSETSSSLGLIKAESCQSPLVKSIPVEMDGVMLPWLQWETSNDTFPPLAYTNKSQHTPISKSNLWVFDSSQDSLSGHDMSVESISSKGSWSPHEPGRNSVNPRISRSQILKSGPRRIKVDISDYLNRPRDVDILRESWKQRHRISSGGMVLCSRVLI